MSYELKSWRTGTMTAYNCQLLIIIITLRWCITYVKWGAKTRVTWSRGCLPWLPVRHQGLHINFAGVASRRNSVAVRSSVAALLSSSSNEQDDNDEQTLLLLLMTVALVFGGSSEEDAEDNDNRFAGALFSLLAHDSKCSIILWPETCRRSAVHCSASSSWTCPMHLLYPAAYTSGPGDGDDGAEAVEFRFRYLTVISRISAFSSLFTLERSCPPCNQPITTIDQ